MTAFADRRAAGRALAERLAPLAGTDVVVLALPRGGLPVADEVARALGAPLDLVLVRKIGMPGNPELALGAIAGPGGQTMVLNEELVAAFGIDRDTIEAQAAPQRVELERRRKLWGGRLAPGALRGKTVVLVDDGIATGATMRAAIAAVRADKPAQVIVAAPVAPPDVVAAMETLADQVVCLYMPREFTAVGLHYASFPQLDDEEVRRILAAAPRT
ncbi:phosphoribosyltransferase [Tabrizicola sp. YIM 78059]|uniref:phosphoribosyltransferase n=1 Tax=Tabrizicola sp. YIM 78059 TaxID=2529861 RepID=UPI0010AA7A12|nr:phosphoribosyltransferase [Tabrizicola sp. YIM 78059]